ncbi:hypothetical protein CBW16_06655 [Flavobacteriaceae bacterium JJC]|nr:hypothetical protein CBW16_06655 [Flavobacteriaceae bacterium JJC]
MNNNDLQKLSIEQILRTAFSYWNRTLLYQFAYSFLYISLFFIGYFALFKYFGLWDEIVKYSDLVRTDIPAFNKKVEEISKLPQARNFGLAFFFLLALINPLNVGLFKIFRKMDLNEPVVFKDLLAGYQGADFFKFFGFYLFWMIIFTYANALFLLGIFWIFITLFSIPLMFFMNVKTFEGITLTIKSLRNNFVTVLVCVMIAAVFSVSGILLCGIGFLLTFPFWNAMIYTLYQNLFKEIN